MSEKDVVKISVYLPRELKDKIQEYAKAQHRTMNEIIFQLCESQFGKETMEETIQNIIQRLEAVEKEVFKK